MIVLTAGLDPTLLAVAEAAAEFPASEEDIRTAVVVHRGAQGRPFIERTALI